MHPSVSSPDLYYKTTDENDQNLCPRFGHCNIHLDLIGKLSASLDYLRYSTREDKDITLHNKMK